MIIRLSMALSNGNKKSVDDAAFEISPNTNKPNPSPVKDADLPNTFFNPSLVNSNWDEVILIPSDDDEANVNEPIPLLVEDAGVEIRFMFKRLLLNSNWDDVIVVPSDDDEPRAEEDIYTSVNTQVHMKNRKRVFALIDESNSDDEPYWLNAFLF
nr:hypothetical protein [Tanacetum cinerariifolium]